MKTKWTVTWRTALALGVACTAKSSSDQAPAGPAGSGAMTETTASLDRDYKLEMHLAQKQAGLKEDEKKSAHKGLEVDLPVGASAGEDRAKAPAALEPAKPRRDANDGTAPERVARSWFPETFLFEPLVVTDDSGAAVVPVRVPDRLTTWRVLALAHSRSGAQGGTVASFLGTLPTYVDPVVPKHLIKGDRVELPIQIVNTTTQPVSGALEIAASNATLHGGSGPHTVPAQGNAIEHATLVADRAATIALRVGFGSTDAVERVIDVRPAGRPIVRTRSGTLAAPRAFANEPTPGSDPATDRVHLLVFPGALALLRSELAVSTAREGVADDAYALLLAGRAPELLAALGDKPAERRARSSAEGAAEVDDKPDAAVLRELAILTGQRAIRDARTLDVERAALLAEAALAHPQNPVLARLGERAAAYLAQNQRPDGTFSGATGWTLQRLLVVTAEATRATAAASTTTPGRQRAMQVAARSLGAFARSVDQVTDGYTAAAMLASGAITGELADKLRARVRSAIQTGDDGAKYLDVGEGVVRGDGAIPTRVEATALAVLALDGVPEAATLRADLGTTLLGAYTLAHGWGDGHANLVAMRAVLALFRTPLPSKVTVTLAMDGTPVATGTLEGAKLHDVLALDAATPGLASTHHWTLVAEPAVPGLGYSLAFDSWVPWEKQEIHAGLELVAPAAFDAAVGKPRDITVTAIAPAGMPLHIAYALPAGVQVDQPALQKLVEAGVLERFVAADGAVDLYAPALEPGKTFSATLRAIPTLAGTLHAGPSLLEAGGAQFLMPPSEWTIR